MSDWVIRFIDETGYWGVFLLMLAETVFPPIPSEVIMTVAGIRAASGPMTLAGVVGSGTAGAMLGNFLWFLLARSIGIVRLKPWVERYGRWLTLDWCEVEKAERLFGRFGSWVVLIARMLPAFRTIISVPAGLLRMRLKLFLFWSTVGTAGWSALLALAGFGLGSFVDGIEKVVGPISSAVIIAIVAAYVWRQLTWHKRHPKP